MNQKIKNYVITAAILLSVTSCKNEPKVIAPTVESEESTKPSGVFSNESSSESKVDFNNPLAKELHKVIVNEVLPTQKYVYLNVNEGDKQFWIATGKVSVKVGETYFYRGGLLKKNFESKEYNRIFETVYLVTSLVPEKHGNNQGSVDVSDYRETNNNYPPKEVIPTHTEKIVEHKGSIKIAELVKDPKKYEGKTVQLSGVCTKINAGIMDRNWIHIKDGSKDDFDLVVTSSIFVPEGSAITIKAIVILNKDFGAGYKYDLILEEGELVK
jgi:hypothetical protein